MVDVRYFFCGHMDNMSYVISDAGLLGDINGDLSVNIQDVVLLVSLILGSGEFLENGDLNQDGFMDVIDVVQLVGLILGN